MKKILKAIIIAVFTTLAFSGCAEKEDKTLRLLMWNIQNGMWDGQNDNYDRFVEFVKSNDPDVCVWCEAQSIWKTDQHKSLEKEDRYLVENWGEVAARYGHEYWGIGGHRDNYPQVITSKYPITYIDRIVGDEETVVSHGAGWATIEVNGKTINIVTLHTWPQRYAFNAKDRKASAAENGGDRHRAAEMKFICENTIGKVEGAENQFWMMMGDFNSRTRTDIDFYKPIDNEAKYLVHDYIKANTPYIDVIKEKYPDEFKPTTGRKVSRIDYVYCTRPLFDRITYADVVWDDYTTPVRDTVTNFWRPSDHLPIMIDFDMK